jgi:hypothetical protein
MKNKGLLYLFFCVVVISCTSPRYLPEPERIPQHPFGSYIQLECKNNNRFTGELISVEKDHIIVLGENTGKCIAVEKNQVLAFSLQYAQSRHYGWTIPLSSLVSLSHGMFAIFTFPVNLITTIAVTGAGEGAFVYKSENMTYNELKMFARFPQGLPSNIMLSDIR